MNLIIYEPLQEFLNHLKALLYKDIAYSKI